MRIKINGQLTSSVQRVILEVLQDVGYRWLPFFGGEGALRTRLGSENVSVSFLGQDTVIEDGVITEGTIDKIKIFAFGATKATAVLVDFGDLPFQDLTDNAAAIPNDDSGRPEYSTDAFRDFRNGLSFQNATISGVTANGSNHRDVLEGTTGIDVLNGRGGNDVFVLRAENSLAGNTIGPDIFRGGKGKKDMFDASEMDQAIALDFGSGKAAFNDGFENGPFASFGGIEGINATRFDDVIVGDDKANIILTGKGNDSVHGKGGNDVIKTGGGQDIVNGGSGNDRINSGKHNDIINGGSGNDHLNGDSGKDTIDGGIGSDTIEGGKGNDELNGGLGNDFFNFTVRPFTGKQGKDHINDFDKNDDTLRIIGDLDGTVEVTQKFGNTIIDYGNGTIVLDNVLLSEAEINIEFVDEGF